jgi:hypothetical protein
MIFKVAPTFRSEIAKLENMPGFSQNDMEFVAKVNKTLVSKFSNNYNK